MAMNSIAASGIPTYADVKDIVEALVHIEGRKSPIPGMDFEDIAQEIRLECVRVLSSFDHTRIGPSPFKYLQTCVRNFLYNQRRGIWVPNNPPCVRCPLWDRMQKTCLVDEVDCDKIVKYRANMATKAALRQPATLKIEVSDNIHEENLDALLLDQSIREALPDAMIPYYDKMLLGEKIPPRIKRQIREITMGVINDA